MDYFYSVSNAKKKKKKGKAAPVKLSTDPQSVAARERRHRISERFKTLQCLVPGGAKMDTVSMLDEAIHYVKFLKTQIWLHETLITGYDEYQSFKAVADDASYSESFQLQPELPNPDSHSSVDDVAFAVAAGQSSWAFE